MFYLAFSVTKRKVRVFKVIWWMNPFFLSLFLQTLRIILGTRSFSLLESELVIMLFNLLYPWFRPCFQISGLEDVGFAASGILLWKSFGFTILTSDRLQNLHFNNALVAFIPIFGFCICFKLNNCGKVFYASGSFRWLFLYFGSDSFLVL